MSDITQFPIATTPIDLTKIASLQELDSVFKTLLVAFNPIYPIGPNNLGIVLAAADKSDNLLFGLMPNGSALLGPTILDQSADNSLDVKFGVVGPDGTLPFGVTKVGNVLMAGAQLIPLSGDNSLGAKACIADKDGRSALVIYNEGTADILSPHGPVYEAAGDIYAVDGNTLVQLTSTGDNFAPFNAGFGLCRFVSTRRRGVPIAYQVARDTPDAEVVSYATRRLYELVIGWGQSLMQGGANAAETTTPPYPNSAFRFLNGPIGSNDETLGTTLEPLREEVYETICTSFARAMLDAAQDRKLIMAGQAWGGMQIEEMAPGGSTGVYEKILAQVEAAAALQGGAHCRAILVIHGEADGLTSDLDYDIDLRQLLDAFNADIKARLKQTDDLVMLFCQTSSNRYYDGVVTADNFTTPLAQLTASEDNDDMFLVGPKYWLTYNNGGNDSHIDAPSVKNLGDKYRQVYHLVIDRGIDWRPVSPVAVSVAGNDVVIDFYSPIGRDLQFDTVNVTDPGDYGFNLLDAGGATITGVALTGTQQVTVTLSAPPMAGWRLSYAFHNGTDGYSGPTAGARGCLRDDDPLIGLYTGDPLHNWCVAFNHNF